MGEHEKDKLPESGPIGNRDPNKRGRGGEPEKDEGKHSDKKDDKK